MRYRVRRERTLRWVAGGAAALLLVGGGVALVVTNDRPEAQATFEAPADTTVAPPSTTTTTTPSTTTSTSTTSTSSSTTSTSTTTTTTLAIQETEPVDAPSGGREPHVELGTISIPKLGVSYPMLEGIRLSTLNNGPGHWPGTAMPGQVGNVVVAGHRTSHGAEFRRIDQLAPGDEIVFTVASGTWTYRVTGTQIVTPNATWIVNPTAVPTATLFACHPPGSTRQRIVVFAALAN